MSDEVPKSLKDVVARLDGFMPVSVYMDSRRAIAVPVGDGMYPTPPSVAQAMVEGITKFYGLYSYDQCMRMFPSTDGLDKRAIALLSSHSRRAGFVYLMWERESGYYKIGQSIDPEKRLQQIRVAFPSTLIETAIETSDMDWAEGYLHRMYNRRRVFGEWFALDGHEVEFIMSIKRIIRGALIVPDGDES